MPRFLSRQARTALLCLIALVAFIWWDVATDTTKSSSEIERLSILDKLRNYNVSEVLGRNTTIASEYNRRWISDKVGGYSTPKADVYYNNISGIFKREAQAWNLTDYDVSNINVKEAITNRNALSIEAGGSHFIMDIGLQENRTSFDDDNFAFGRFVLSHTEGDPKPIMMHFAGYHELMNGTIIFVANQHGLGDYLTDLASMLPGNTTKYWSILQARRDYFIRELEKENSYSSDDDSLKYETSCVFMGLLKLKPLSCPNGCDFKDVDELQQEILAPKLLPTKIPFQWPALDAIELISPNCLLQINASSSTSRDPNIESIPMPVLSRKISHFLFIVLLSSLVDMYLFHLQTKTTAERNETKFSFLSFAMLALISSTSSLVILSRGSDDSHTLLIVSAVSFTRFLIFSSYEMRFVVAIFRSWMSSIGNEGNIRRDLVLIYCSFYVIMFIEIISFGYFGTYLKIALLFINYSFWWPQIIKNLHDNSVPALDNWFILCYSLTKLLLPLYFMACPFNFLLLSLKSGSAFYLCLWVTLQVLILIAQLSFGPKCIIYGLLGERLGKTLDEMLFPKVYDYYRHLQNKKEDDLESGSFIPLDVKCSVCFEEFGEDTDELSQTMITPCNHLFHESCLRRWMKRRSLCPICRSSLP